MIRRICFTKNWKRAHAATTRSSAGAPRAGGFGPLFNGTLSLVDLTLTGNGRSLSVPPADLAVALSYLQLAAPVIGAYASQYGAASLALAPSTVPLSVPIRGSTYSDAELQTWVNGLVQSGRLSAGSAAIVLNPMGAENADAREQGGVGVLGYHGAASVPYGFVNLLGSGFTVDDRSNLFAEALSHEIAELTVDPRADGGNPEVADGCGTNCLGDSAYRAFFDTSSKYLASVTDFPPPFPYRFFISAVVRPASATDCPAPATACAYAPP